MSYKMLTALPLKSSTTAQGKITIIEVYVDDFIGCTNNILPAHLTQVSRAMLHGIHALFPPPAITRHCGEDPISESKLRKGDGEWRFEKDVLGWLVNGANFTIQLPKEKCQKICRQIRNMLHLWSAPPSAIPKAGRTTTACQFWYSRREKPIHTN